MQLNPAEIESIAHLARLGIEATDKPAYAHDLSSLLELVAQMNELATDNVAPMSHPLDTYQRLRSDEVLETDQRAYFQTLAPQIEAGLYLVPQVID